MSDHAVQIHWRHAPRGDGDYSRSHAWTLTQGQQVQASAAVEFAGDADRTNPEEGLVAALASCHMLTFLAVATKRGYAVQSYADDAVGTLAKNAQGRLAITHIRLRPRIEFGGAQQPAPEELVRLHEAAHRSCFIANSIQAAVTIE